MKPRVHASRFASAKKRLHCIIVRIVTPWQSRSFIPLDERVGWNKVNRRSYGMEKGKEDGIKSVDVSLSATRVLLFDVALSVRTEVTYFVFNY